MLAALKSMQRRHNATTCRHLIFVQILSLLMIRFYAIYLLKSLHSRLALSQHHHHYRYFCNLHNWGSNGLHCLTFILLLERLFATIAIHLFAVRICWSIFHFMPYALMQLCWLCVCALKACYIIFSLNFWVSSFFFIWKLWLLICAVSTTWQRD